MIRNSIRTLRWIFICTCAGTILADWLFYRQPSGINLAVFHAFVVLLAATQVPSFFSNQNRILALSLAGLLLAMAAQPGPLILCLFWLLLLAYGFSGRQGWSSNSIEWIARWCYFGVIFLFAILKDLILVMRWRNSGHGGDAWTRFGRELAKWFVPVAGSLLFIALFKIANPVLSHWIHQWSTFADKFLNSLTIRADRIFFWFLIASLLWTLCRMRYRRRHFPEPGPGKPLSASLLVRCLALFNIVFAAQTVMDFVYLWGGASLPAGMTYAEYAHRGAYPLIVTALLSGAFVLVTTRAGLPTHETAIARRLTIVWLAQNILLTLNSLWRLHLYVEVYSLTRLRFSAAIWMILVSAGIVLIILRIYTGKSNAWLLNANFLILGMVLYGCCFVNFDAIISRYNVRHSREISGTGYALDIQYLENLGVESTPSLIWFHQNAADSCKAAQAQVAAGRLTQDLHKEWANWRSHTIRKYQLIKETPRIEFQAFGAGNHQQESCHTAKSVQAAGMPVL